MNELTEWYKQAAEVKRATKKPPKKVLSWQLVYIFGGKTQVVEADKPYPFLVAKRKQISVGKGVLKIVPYATS
jgi:hypothetical protein